MRAVKTTTETESGTKMIFQLPEVEAIDEDSPR